MAVVWNDTPTNPVSQRDVATIYSATDQETYKGYSILRGKDPSVTKEGKSVSGLEGMYTTYNLAKAAIDHFEGKSTIKDVVTVSPLS